MVRNQTTFYLANVFCLFAVLLSMLSCQDNNAVVGTQDRIQVEQDTMKVYTVKLTGVTIHPIEKEETEDGVAFSWSDTLENQITFEAVPEFNVLDSTTITKPPEEERLSYKIVNPVESSTARPTFKFNKPVIFKDMKIRAGKNFMADSVLSGFVDFPSTLHPAGRAQLELDMDHFFIPPKQYIVKASWQTEEGEVFIDSTSVFINMR